MRISVDFNHRNLEAVLSLSGDMAMVCASLYPKLVLAFIKRKHSINKNKIETIMFKDYYLILGIGKNATTEEIEKAFENAKAKSNGDTLKDVQEAYAVLSKEESKALYDEELEAFDKSDNYEKYQIQNQELARIIESLQTNENDEPISSGCADKMRKGCMWVLMFIVFFILHTCVGAIMKQKGREAAKRSYSYVIPQK